MRAGAAVAPSPVAGPVLYRVTAKITSRIKEFRFSIMKFQIVDRSRIRTDNAASYCHRPDAIVMTRRLDCEIRGVPRMAERVVRVAPATTTLREA
jgi:glycerate-2-kinase